ncbi:YtxC-like family protein [compost metagenome]
MKNILIDVKKGNSEIFDEISKYVCENKIDENSIKLSFDKILKIEVFDEKIKDSFLKFISKKIADYILLRVEPDMIMKEVKEECMEFFSDEIEDIFQKAQWELIYKNDESIIEHLENINNNVFDGLKANGMFNLTGFLNFKYEDRKLEIKECVNITLDESLTNDDYHNFVNILKKFINIQKSKIDTVHVIILAEDDFEIITSDNERVDLREVEDIWDEELIENQIQKEQIYIIMSLLMTLSPQNIIIHTNDLQDPFISQTLKNIYRDRATVCNDCKLCNSIRETRKK